VLTSTERAQRYISFRHISALNDRLAPRLKVEEEELAAGLDEGLLSFSLRHSLLYEESL
jgi:hypothetical protein